MPFALSEAVLRGLARRAAATLSAAPLLAAGLLLALLAAPVLALRGGAALGHSLGPSFASTPFALSFSSSVLLAALTVGVFAAAVTPRLAQLDDQLLVTPPSRGRLFAAVTLAPLCVPLAGVGLLALAFFLSFGRGLPSGAPGGLVLLIGAAAATAVGAGLAESVTRLRAEPARGLFLLLLLCCAWAASALPVAGTPLAGPVALVAAAAAGSVAVWPALAGLAVLAALALLAFLVAVATEPPAARAGVLRVRPVLPLRGSAWAHHVVVELKTLGRRADLRRNAVSVVVATPVVGLLLQTSSPLPQLSVFFAGLLAVLGSAAFPLAAAGLDRPATWLWVSSGTRSGAHRLAPLLAALLVQLAVVLAAGGALVALLDLPARALASVLGATACVGALALVAGALVPWRADSATDQAATYGVLAALVAGLYLPGTWVVARLHDGGVPGGVLLVAGPLALLAACLGLALALTTSKEED